MEVHEITCINCPLGCALKVSVENGSVVSVEGNTCPRGKLYGEKEVTQPVRMVTSTVRVLGGVRPVVSGKTSHEIPKDAVFKVAEALCGVSVKAPLEAGDVLVENVAGTGIDFIATADVATA